MSSLVPEGAPRPRLCHIRKWSDFQGYGFNLHAEKGKAGQFIGKIDPESPAEFAGLKDGDRIVEVNGTNIGNENHQQVVQRIKSRTDETTLLVVDSEADEYYKDKKIVVRGDMPNVLVGTAPERNPNSLDNGHTGGSSHGSEHGDDLPTPIPGSGYRARHCHLVIWPDFQGYGFNLHAEKSKTGQYIGKVDDGSPADAAGLRERDRILEVNGDSVVGESHQAVVSRIKAVPNQTRMLVVDPEADAYFQENGITIDSSSPYVDVIKCPDERTGSNVVTAVSSSVPLSHKVRLIQLRTWSNYNGYGFNMHSIKGRQGEFIGKVETGSPAHVAGLREGDRIIEVDGVNVETDGHNEVVEKIKKAAGSAQLLVVDRAADEYYQKNEIRIDSSLSSVTVLECPELKPEANGTADIPEAQETHSDSDQGDVEDENAVENNNDDKDDRIEEVETSPPEYRREDTPPPAVEVMRDPEPELRPVTPDSPKSPVVIGGVEFPASVEEARKKMSGKKRDTRMSQNMSAKEKYDLFQRL